MNDMINSPVFGVLISIIAYEIGLLIKQKLKLSIFNPLLIAIVILITFLLNLILSMMIIIAGDK